MGLDIGTRYCEEIERAHHLVEVYQYDVLEQLNSNSKSYRVCASSVEEAKSKAIQKYTDELYQEVREGCIEIVRKKREELKCEGD